MFGENLKLKIIKKLLLILLCLPMIGFGQEQKIFLIKDARIKAAAIDCFFLQELCENIQKGIGVSFYKTGEKRIEVSCQNTMDWWDPLKVTYYYRNGNKKSEEIYYGCETEMGPYTTWWENGNLKYRGDWDGDFYADKWYENGQIKQDFEIKYGDGLGVQCVTKEAYYYENGQIKSWYICEDCEPTMDYDYDCSNKKCWDEEGNKIKCNE